MTFNFFNPSHLAFGSKLTKAFNQLNKLCNEAEDNLDYLFQIYDTYKQYINRNYRAPFPTRGDAPCRVDELFDLINDAIIIKSLEVTEEEKFHCAINIFKRSTNRLTVAEGITELKKGYAFVRSSTSNQSPNRDIQFVENISEGQGSFLFQYRIDSDGSVNIIDEENNYFLPSNFNQVTGMKKGDTIYSGHIAEEYEAVVIIGYARWGNNGEYTDGSPWTHGSCLDVQINGNSICSISGWQCRQYTVVYLKPGDKLTGSFKQAFKVNYTKTSVPVPTPAVLEMYRKNAGNGNNATASAVCTADAKLDESSVTSIISSGRIDLQSFAFSGDDNLAIKLPRVSDGTFRFTGHIKAEVTSGTAYRANGAIQFGKIGSANYGGAVYNDTEKDFDFLVPEGYDTIIFSAGCTTYIGPSFGTCKVSITNLHLY